MAAPGIESGHRMSCLIQPHGKLNLVAVPLRQGGRQHRKNLLVKMSQPGKGILHKAGFGRTFRLIAHVTQPASSAGGAYGAVRGDASRAGDDQPLHTAKGVAFHGFDNPAGDHIPRRGAGHKNGLALHMGHAIAVTGKVLHSDLENLIFDHRHRNSSNDPLKLGGLFQCGQVLAGGHALDLLEDTGKIELVKKADGDRDFGDGKPGVFQQGTRFADAVAR